MTKSHAARLLTLAVIALALPAAAQAAPLAAPALFTEAGPALIVPVHCANNHGKGCDGPPPAPPSDPGCSAGCGPVKDFRS